MFWARCQRQVVRLASEALGFDSPCVHMSFFVTEEGKQRSWKHSKEEFEQYRNVCLTIWGAMPLDVTWATGTKLYQETLKEIIRRKLGSSM